MRYTGLKYIFNDFNIDINQIDAAFDFKENTTFSLNVQPNFWAINSATGILNNTSSFYNFSGTGYFNGNNLMRLNKPITLNNNSILLLSYEKLRQADEILVSSITGNSFNTYSGFCIGVNNANKLYFKYWNPVEGPFSFTCQNTLSDKNLITVSKNGPIISMGHFNNNTFEFELEPFEIKGGQFRESNQIFLGGKNVNVPWVPGVNFSGYVDYFYIFNNISDLYLNNIGSGVFSNIYDVDITGSNCINSLVWKTSGYLYSGITGTRTVTILSTGDPISGYELVTTEYCYTGITGYQRIIIGTQIQCGKIAPIYFEQPISGLICDTIETSIATYQTIPTGICIVEEILSGSISGTTGFFTFENVCTDFFSGTVVSGSPDILYLQSLSSKEISLLKPLEDISFSTGNLLEIYYEKYKPVNLFYNQNLNYDRVNNNFFSNNLIDNETILFANGQALINSGYNLIQSDYNTLIIPNNDYMVTGDRVETNRFFGGQDSLFYDSFSGRFVGLENSGNFITISNNISKNFWLFKNGQKLISGRDYLTLNSQLLNLVGVEPTEKNIIIIKEIPDNFLYFSGNFGSIKLTGNFNNTCSQVYLNGIKQKINYSYLENGNFDMISGIFYENQNSYIIYNNTDDFFV
jgi:hypothetical protein